MNVAPVLLLSTFFITASISAQAQTETRSATIYRCGPDGRELRDHPCPAGTQAKAEQVNFTQPSSSQIQAAQNQTIETAIQADQMEQDRLHREAHEKRHAAKAGAIDGLGGAPKAKPAKPPQVTQLKPPKTERPRKPRTQPNAG